MLLVLHPFEKRKAAMATLPRIQSEPAMHKSWVGSLTANTDPRTRRKSTVSYPAEHFHPRMVLELILSQPCHAYIGIGPNLRPLIELTIRDLQDEFSDNTNVDDAYDKELIDEALLRLEIEEFKSFVPLQASIQNFETILDQKYTNSLIKAVCHALIGSFLAGYNTSLLNVPALLIQSQCNLSLETFSFLQSIYCVGGLFGALIAGYSADKCGRKFVLLFANLQFMLSGIISMLYAFNIFGDINTPQFTFKYFIISRLISGLASGISTAIVPTYLGEISPPIIRGEIGTLNAFINAFGILFAEIIGFNYLFGNAKLWMFIFVVNVIPCCIQLLFIKSLCESPQWLLFNNFRDRARDIFMLLRESQNVEFDMRSIKTKKYYEATAKINNNRTQTPSPKTKHNMYINSKQKYEKSSLLDDVLEAEHKEYGSTQRNSVSSQLEQIEQIDMEHIDMEHIDSHIGMKQNKLVLFYIFFMTICLQLVQQLSGINSVWYYSSIMLQNAGLTSSFQLWIGNILIASSNFFGVLIPVKLIEKIGRKLLLYLSCIGMIVASIFLSIVLMFAKEIQDAAGYLSIIILIMYVISFAMGLGPIVGLLTVELSPSSHRGTIVSVAFFINYSANLFVAQYANFVVESIYYLPFAGICLLGIVFTYFCLPETKGKKENDIQAEILYKVTRQDNYMLY